VTLLLLIAGLRETIAAEFWLPGWEASGCEAERCPPDTPHHGFPLMGAHRRRYVRSEAADELRLTSRRI
jgi:hypothetical protein